MSHPYHAASVVQRARLLKTRKLSALDIAKALADEGHKVDPVTVHRWTTNQYRLSGDCPVKRARRFAKLRRMTPPCVSDKQLRERQSRRASGNKLIGHHFYRCTCAHEATQ